VHAVVLSETFVPTPLMDELGEKCTKKEGDYTFFGGGCEEPNLVKR